MPNPCRLCGAPLRHLFVDLGCQPSANRFLPPSRLGEPEPVYPLRAWVCERCKLVQLADDHGAEEVFDGDYVYFSSYSASWVDHAGRYAGMMTERFGLDERSLVVEIASNDGYLLQHFVKRGIRCLGIDPAAATAKAAAAKGVETLVAFFGQDLARVVVAERGQAHVIAANNVLAHVPDLNDFIAGLAIVLDPRGVLTVEVPHLARLIRYCQFDTIYDEHFSYFSLGAAMAAFARHRLQVFDVEEVPTHGGSLRLFIRHSGSEDAIQPGVQAILERERALGMETLAGYQGFQARVDAIRNAFLAFIQGEKAKGSRIAAFGAAAKGNTFLNTCGVRADVVEFVVDDTPAKQGKFLPGSHIPVVSEEHIAKTRPDVILILPWNVKDEIAGRLEYARAWGCRFVTCIPEITVQ